MKPDLCNLKSILALRQTRLGSQKMIIDNQPTASVVIFRLVSLNDPSWFSNSPQTTATDHVEPGNQDIELKEAEICFKLQTLM